MLPHLDYCSLVWNSCGTTLSDRVERVQNYALRIILRKPPRTSSEALCQTLSWTTLKRRRHNATVCQVHRCVNKQAPSNLNSKFMTNSTLNCACTRDSNKLHLKRLNTNFYCTTFEYMGAQLFNSLPEEIRASCSSVLCTVSCGYVGSQFFFPFFSQDLYENLLCTVDTVPK